MAERDMPLSFAGAGKPLTVTGINGRCGMLRRLADMGLTIGTTVTVVNGCHPGPLLVDIRGSRLGLGFGVAQKIMVKEVTDSENTNRGRPGRQPQLRQDHSFQQSHRGQAARRQLAGRDRREKRREL